MPPHVNPGSCTAPPPKRRGRLAVLSILTALLSGLAVMALGVSPAAAIPIELLDDAGPDDEPGQKDLNSLVVDLDPPAPGTINVMWNWDYDQADLSGGNSADACALIDTDDDGNTNYSLCVIWGDDGDDSNGAENGYITTRLYECGDGQSDKCDQSRTLIAEDMNGDGDLADPGEALVGGPYGSTCSLEFGATDPFGSRDGSQASATGDAKATCVIVLDDFGADDAFLINVCSYPSQVPGSDPSDCVITPNRGFLTIEKIADPDDGTEFTFALPPAATFIEVKGSEPDIQGPFEFTVEGSGSLSLISVNAGTWDLAELVPDGWQVDSADCVIAGADSGVFDDVDTVDGVEIQAGRETFCTFTNSLQVANLTLLKDVTNDNGGDATIDAWTLAAAPVEPEAVGISGTSGVTGEILAGAYDLSEASGPDGFSQTDLSCDGGQLLDDRLTLVPGDDVTCTFFNDDDAPSLSLIKNVTNDNGGAAVPGDWTLTAAGYDDASPQAGTAFALSESGPDGYSLVDLSCDGGIFDGDVEPPTITLGLGDEITCTFFNDDNEPGLTLIKQVTNDNGGTAVAGDWTLTAAGYDSQDPEAGTYDLSESGPDGYSLTSLTCSNTADDQVTSVTIDLGEQVTCTFVNDDIAPSLTLVKEVDNGDGGQAVPGDWDLFASGYNPMDRQANEAFALTESDGPDGYTLDSISCDGGTFDDTVDPPTITLGLDEDVICTFINDDVAPGLTLEKKVVNNNGGEAKANEWTLAATDADGAAFDGKPGTYKLTESGGPDGYELTGVECEGGVLEKIGDDYFVTVALGESVECTFTNDDIAPSLTLIKLVENDEGRTAGSGDFTLSAGDNDVTGSEMGNVATDQAGTYDLTESGPDGYTLESLTCDNTGDAEVFEATVGLGEDVTCTFVNGDDLVPAPAIGLEKEAEPTTARIFDDVTYTFTATNTGNVPLNNVTITDPLVGLSPITCDDTTAMGKPFSGIGTGTLEVGDSIACTAVVTVTPDLITDGTLDNVAEATGEYPGDPAQVVDDDGSASVIIISDVEGCTYTQGYWRTHAGKAQPNGNNKGKGKGPAADPTWHEVGGAHAYFGRTGGQDYTYYEALWASPKGDAWLILAQQYIAAELNSLTGDTTSVDAVVGESLLGEARDLLNTDSRLWDAHQWARALALSEAFDQYNNGEVIHYNGGVFIGPPHCG